MHYIQLSVLCSPIFFNNTTPTFKFMLIALVVFVVRPLILSSWLSYVLSHLFHTFSALTSTSLETLSNAGALPLICAYLH
ncbi:hypothetical protein EV424DRAFT_208659 [Suillus variegatus]|nr:hypothetical protein EV424DRAFT_208659 [Suillus variegatus]